MTETLGERLVTHAKDTGLFPQAGRALLAVSGGPDSTALLDLMYHAAGQLDLDLEIAHIDHGILSGSAAVGRQVTALGNAYNVPVRVAALSLGSAASETLAREARYAELRRIQRETGARYLVTAHHLDDQVETVLYRLLKGSGVAGLAGILPVGSDGLVRPLLPFTRAELRDWLERSPTFVDSGFSPHADAANRETRHDRVWVRQQVLPRLRERFGPELESNILEVARSAMANRSAWSSLLKTLPELEFRLDSSGAEVARPALQRYDNVLSVALLQALVREAGHRLGRKRAARVLDFVVRGSSGHYLELDQGWKIEIVFDRVRCTRGDVVVGERPVSSWGEDLKGVTEWGDWKLDWRIDKAGAVKRRSFTTWVTPGTGMIRSLRIGDRMTPLGGVGSRQVRRLLMEAKISRRLRWVHPVVERDGEIIWIPGVCRSATLVPEPGDEALRIDVYKI